MKNSKIFSALVRGVANSTLRFPLTIVFLFAAAVVNSIGISTDQDLGLYFMTCLTGAMLAAVAQILFERFSERDRDRDHLLFMTGALLFAGLHFLVLHALAPESPEIELRTILMLFALLTAFLLIPVIKTAFAFNLPVLIAFKAFFTSLLYAGVCMGGVSLILRAVDRLLFSVPENAYGHTANLVFVLFLPIVFLSMIPGFPGQKYHAGERDEASLRKEEQVEKAGACPKLLDVLLSRIVIPLLGVYTIILVAYLVLHAGADFWSANLLEPLLISYTALVIVVFLLAGNLPNRICRLFSDIVPKIMAPLAFFQVAASLMDIPETGVTYTKYFAIVYGVYAAVAGLIMSLFPRGKNHLLALLLFAVLVLSMLPPLDAFSVSRNSQTEMLTKALSRNAMLTNGVISADPSISDEDKRIISNAVLYLAQMRETGRTGYLPDDYAPYEDFYSTFGFHMVGGTGENTESIYLYLEDSASVPVDEYDSYIGPVRIESETPDGKQEIATIIKEKRYYFLQLETDGQERRLLLTGENQEVLMRLDVRSVLTAFEEYAGQKDSLSADQAVFSEENGQAKMTVLVEELSVDRGGGKEYYSVRCGIFIRIK